METAAETVDYDDEASEQETDDPDARIREALTRYVGREGLSETKSAGDDYNLAEQLEAELRSKAPLRVASDQLWDEDKPAPTWQRPALPLDTLLNSASDARQTSDEPFDEPFENTSLDNQLLQDIVETRDKSGSNEKSSKASGGLALAAAWGLFLSIAAGIIVGVFAFRDMAVNALPGLAPFYRTVGMPVTVQPLMLEDVQSRWDRAASKPTLIISGVLVNRAKRKVTVPEVLITIKDEDPQLDREYTANLPMSGRRLRSEQREDFEIELVSPNLTINAVELELRNVR